MSILERVRRAAPVSSGATPAPVGDSLADPLSDPLASTAHYAPIPEDDVAATPTQYADIPGGESPTQYADIPSGDASASPTHYAAVPSGDEPATPTQYADIPGGDASASPTHYAAVPSGDEPATPTQYADIPGGDASESPTHYAAVPSGDEPATPTQYAEIPVEEASEAPTQYAAVPSDDAPPSHYGLQLGDVAIAPATPSAPPMPAVMPARPAPKPAPPPDPERPAPDLAARAAWHEGMARDKRLATTPLQAKYRGEESASSEADKHGHLPSSLMGRKVVGTKYAASAAEYGVSAEGGVLSQGGAVLDSVHRHADPKARSGVKALWAKDRDERLNFAIDGAGGLYASNPMADMESTLMRRTVQRSNHSSMVAGADVAAAGTMKVRGGKVEEIGDDSGHYQPALPYTAQAVSELGARGVMDEDRSSVRLASKGMGGGDLLMSARELSAWSGELQQAREAHAASGDASALHAPEARIRQLHKKSADMRQQLKATAEKNGGDDVSVSKRFGLRHVEAPAPRPLARE